MLSAATTAERFFASPARAFRGRDFKLAFGHVDADHQESAGFQVLVRNRIETAVTHTVAGTVGYSESNVPTATVATALVTRCGGQLGFRDTATATSCEPATITQSMVFSFALAVSAIAVFMERKSRVPMVKILSTTVAAIRAGSLVPMSHR